MDVQINRDESNAIKGLLIFLIVLGHNAFITNYIQGIYHYLYSFHVACFFILSFSYPAKQLSKERIENYFIRMYSPYVAFFLLFLIAKIAFTHYGINIEGNSENTEKTYLGCLSALINGGIHKIPIYIGFQYLWFLPTMFSFSVLKDYYYTTNNVQKRLMLVGGAVCFICLYVFMYTTPYDKGINMTIERYSLFSVLQALGIFFLSWCSLLIVGRCKNKKVILIAFVALTTMYWMNMDVIGVKWTVRCFMPMVVFAILYHYKGWLQEHVFLRKIGKVSMPIYLVQTPIATICYILFPKIMNCDNIIFILFSQIFIFGMSYYVGTLLTKIPIMKQILFPRTMKEWMGKE